MNEEKLIAVVRQHLNSGLRAISPLELKGLAESRQMALQRQKAPQTQQVMQLAGAHGVSYRAWGLADIGQAFSRSRGLRIFLAVFFLMTGMLLASIWKGHAEIAELVEVDSALLSEELPPDAFLDKGFAGWLSYSSSE